MSDAPRVRGASAAIIKFFVERPNKLVFLDDIKKATGLDARHVQNAISNVKAKGYVIETNVRGSAWTYRPAASYEGAIPASSQPYIPNPPLPAAQIQRGGVQHPRYPSFAVVNPLPDGRYLLKDEHSEKLWVAKEI